MLGVVLSCSESFLELTPEFAVSDAVAITNVEDMEQIYSRHHSHDILRV